jgi:hypothetical protein
MNRKTITAMAVGLAAALLVGYGAGRYAAPVKTVERVKVEVVEKQVVVTQVKVEKEYVAVADRNADTRVNREVVEVVKPDGTKTTTTKETTDTKETSRESVASTSTTTSTKVEAKESTKVEERAVRVARGLPTWTLGVDAGVVLPALVGDSRPARLVPGLPRWAEVGISLDRRLFGPVKAGVRVGSMGSVGVALKVEF